MRPTILLLFLMAVSCSRQPDSTTEISEDQDEVYEPVFSMAKAEADTEPTDTSQVLSFEIKGAIPVYPDTAWFNQEQKSMDEESWNTILDDSQYYQSMAIDTLESVGVNVYPVDIVYKRFYKFKLAGDGVFVADMYKIRGEWGIILYNGRDVPSFCAPINVPEVMDSLLNK